MGAVKSRVSAGRTDTLQTVAFFIVLGLIWEYSVRIFEVKSYLLPPLSDIFVEIWRSRALLWEQTLITTAEVVLGFGLRRGARRRNRRGHFLSCRSHAARCTRW